MPRFSFAAILILLIGLTISFSTFVVNAVDKKKDEKQTLDDKAILQLVNARTSNFVRVTEKPVPMKTDVATLCKSSRQSNEIMKARKDDPHWRYDLHVYVPKESERIIRSGKGSYPVGALIIKEKLPEVRKEEFNKTNENSGNGSKISTTKESEVMPALFTAMLKREKGYNPECGDWEFITISGDAKQVTSRGATETCMGCHKKYKETDFVTRTYMKDEPPAKNKSPIDKKTSNKK